MIFEATVPFMSTRTAMFKGNYTSNKEIQNWLKEEQEFARISYISAERK